MQCWNCGFENLPGLAACGRCASRLDLACVPVEPPRASRWRLGTRVATATHQAARILPTTRSVRAALEPLLPEEVSLRELAWCVIPGYGLIRGGRRLLGRAVLTVWLVLALGLILALGTPWQPVLLMLMVAVHGTGFTLVLAANLAWERFITRAAFGLVVFAALYLLIYAPLAGLTRRIVHIVQVGHIAQSGALRPGDTLLLAGPWFQRRSKVGDIVLYDMPQMQGFQEYVRGGAYIDRIIAGPGDHVVLAGGVLLVNGTPPQPQRSPLAAIHHALSLDTVVPGGTYLILPTTADFAPGRASSSLVSAACFVPRHQIVSRVVFRVRPLARWGPLE